MIGTKSDSAIQQDVLRELKWDTRVEETEVGVIVNKGIVTLTGIVSGYGKKMAAEEAAHRVAGVLDVANDIEVRTLDSFDPTDTQIAKAVRNALDWNIWVPADRIRSTVSDGWVTLEGTVSQFSEREDPERTIQHLRGVRGVTNRITVSGPKVKPEKVRSMIEEALERRAEREAKRINIEIDDGTVTLSGRVKSWAEKQAILGVVSHAPGVQAVDEKLFVDPLT